MSARRLIVNADDFGRSVAVNRGVIRAAEEGIVTSASLMVRWPAAAEAAAWAAGRRAVFSLGLHVDLGEWVFSEGAWRAVYEVAPLDDPVAVEREVERQLQAFRALAGRDPTHLDSHQHVHRDEPVRSVLRAAAAELGAPLRGEDQRIRYCGDFFGQTGRGEPIPGAVGAERLVEIVGALPPGVTELGCHPGLDADLDSAYLHERAEEVDTLCSPSIREAVAACGVTLCSFVDLPGNIR